MAKKVNEIPAARMMAMATTGPDGDPLVCFNCGSHDVQIKAWVDANTLKFKDLCDSHDDEDNYCDECQESTSLINQSEYISNL